MTTTYLIVPALTDQSGQCRIVSTKTQLGACQALVHHRRWPEDWAEVGHTDARGRIAFLAAPCSHWDSLTDDQPLLAGLTYTFED